MIELKEVVLSTDDRTNSFPDQGCIMTMYFEIDQALNKCHNIVGQFNENIIWLKFGFKI